MSLPVSADPLPTSYAFGKIVGRIVHAVADTAEDTDDKPQARAAAGKVTFTPQDTLRKTVDADYPAIITQGPEEANLSSSGRILDAEGRQGLWLTVGIWTVSFSLNAINGRKPTVPSFDIEVTGDYTDEAPLDLATVMPYTAPSGTVVQTVAIPAGGTTGQVLVRAAEGGLVWADQTAEIDLTGYTTDQELTDAIAAIPDPDLSGYVTTDALTTGLSGKADSGHAHDDLYYTETEVDGLLADVQTQPGPPGPVGLVWRGPWDTNVSYAADDGVHHSGRAFIALSASTGVAPPTTATSNASWDLLADRGEAGAGGDASGIGGIITPDDLNLLGWTFDPVLHNGQNTLIENGQMLGVLMNLAPGTLTALHYRVWVAGSGLTAAEVGLIDASTGVRIAVATNQVANMQGGGARRAVFTAPAEWTGGLVYAVALAAGTTMPRLASMTAGDTNMLNTRGLSLGSIIRCGRITTAGSLTAIPATNDLSGNEIQNRPFFFAVD